MSLMIDKLLLYQRFEELLMTAYLTKKFSSINIDIAIWIMTICSIIDTLNSLLDRLN
jgi:hypothetical protein